MVPPDRATSSSTGDDPAGGADSDFVAGFESASEPPATGSPRETPSVKPLESVDWTPPEAPKPSGGAAFAGARGGVDLPDFTPPVPREAVTPAPETARSDPGHGSSGDGDRPHARGRAMPASPPEDVNVENLDRTMAGEIEDLLQTDAGTVEEVLLGMQDDAVVEPATAPDFDPGSSPVPVPSSQPSVAAKPVEPPATEPVEHFESFEAFESIDDLLEEDLAMASSKRIISTEPMVAPRPVTALAIDERPAPDDVTPQPESARLLPASPVRMIILVLRVLNYPLRLVPPRLRLLVDLIALTLIFWVPIVWAIALFVVGR